MLAGLGQAGVHLLLTVAARAALWAHAVVGIVLIHTPPTCLTQLFQPYPCAEESQIRHGFTPPCLHRSQHHRTSMRPSVTRVSRTPHRVVIQPPPNLARAQSPTRTHTSAARTGSVTHGISAIIPLPRGDRGIHHPGPDQLCHVTHPPTLSHTPHPARTLCHSLTVFTLARCAHTPSGAPHPASVLPLTELGCGLPAGHTPDVTEAAAPPRRAKAVEGGPGRGAATPVLTGRAAAPVYQRLEGKLSASALEDPRGAAPQLLQGLGQAPTPEQPSKFLLGGGGPGDPAHLTLRASEALRAGAAEARVGSSADAPVQTGPREAGVGLVLAVCARVAGAALAAERAHAVHAGAAMEAGAGGGGREGSGSAPMQAPPSWPLPPWRGHSSLTPTCHKKPQPQQRSRPFLSLSPNLPSTSDLRWETRGGPALAWPHSLRDQHL